MCQKEQNAWQQLNLLYLATAIWFLIWWVFLIQCGEEWMHSKCRSHNTNTERRETDRLICLSGVSLSILVSLNSRFPSLYFLLSIIHPIVLRSSLFPTPFLPSQMSALTSTWQSRWNNARRRKSSRLCISHSLASGHSQLPVLALFILHHFHSCCLCP